MIPKIDPDVKYVGSSKLRDLTAAELRALTGAIVVQGAQNMPLAVILPYETYLKLQGAAERIESAADRIIGLSDQLSRGPRQKGDRTR